MTDYVRWTQYDGMFAVTFQNNEVQTNADVILGLQILTSKIIKIPIN